MRPNPPSSAAAWEPAAYAAILLFGLCLFFVSRDHPALIPAIGPWDFAPSFYLAAALSLYWYGHGLMLLPAAERPGLWQRLAFLSGLLLLYAVLQTRLEYFAQHMFFLNRLQAIAMHDLGPFLVALGAPWKILALGMPARLRRSFAARPFAAAAHLLHHPLVAGCLFAFTFSFRLIPVVHFRAMLDHRLYTIMNWSMVLGGLLFWSLVLDSRPQPPAQLSYFSRAGLAIAVMLPQMLLAFLPRDLYPYYTLCGRLFPIDPLSDQHIGAILSWVPTGLISLAAALLALNFMRLREEAGKVPDDSAPSLHLMPR